MFCDKLMFPGITALNVFLQFSIYAFDKGNPSRRSLLPAQVTINVLRNQNPPIYTNLPKEIEIEETESANTVIYTVTATDADPVSRTIMHIELLELKSCDPLTWVLLISQFFRLKSCYKN